MTLLDLLRSAWANEAPPVTAKEVTAVRKELLDFQHQSR